MKSGPKFGKDYFDELLEVIKEIRLSKRRLYKKVQILLNQLGLIMKVFQKRYILSLR